VRSSTPRDLSGLCPRCYLKVDLCLCPELMSIESSIQIVIIRHVREERLTSNTGRLAALLLSNVQIVPYGGREPFDEGPLRGEDTWLLFPGAKSAPPRGRPKRLVLLDATFRQARRMYRKISALRHLQCCALSAPEERMPGRRRSPRSDGLSTIEAIATALAQYENPELAAPLMAAYVEFVNRADISSGRKRTAEGVVMASSSQGDFVARAQCTSERPDFQETFQPRE
jgi:DTW domain-containing protein